MTNQPTAATSARFPAGYGTPSGEEDLLPWGYVEEQLRSALNYWVTTISPSGSPHARPVDGVWVSGALCFGGSNETHWVRNLEANPAISVHLPSEAEAIILEGTKEHITEAKHPLAQPSTNASREKYPQYFAGGTPPFRPFWALRPRVAYAWTLEGFPNRATRWTFKPA